MTYDTSLLPLDIGLYGSQASATLTVDPVGRTLEEELDLVEMTTFVEPRRPTLRTRARGWLRRHWLDLGVVAVLMAVGGWVHAAGMYTSPARFDDEGSYTAYAWAVEYLHQLNHYTYWYAHPPIGWLQIAAWTTLTGGFHRAPYAVAAVREFMLVTQLVSIALLYGLSRRLGLTRLGSTAAVAFFALSPLAVYFQRAALLDNIVTPWLLGAFLLAASQRRSIAAAAGSAFCAAMAVLSKETALLYLPAIVLLLWQRTDRRNRRFRFGLFGAVFVLLGACYPLYALVKGELLPGPHHVSLYHAVQWQLFDRQGSGSIFSAKSTAHAVIRSWVDLDPWLPRLSLALLLPGLLIRRTRAVAVAFAIQLVQLLRNGYLPYPYVIAMIPFAALTAAGVLDAVWQAGRVRFLDSRWDPRCGLRVLLSRLRHRWAAATRRRRAGAVARLGLRGVTAAACSWLVLTVGTAWAVPLQQLRTMDRDAGMAQALTWLKTHVSRNQVVVVDDAFWVDLVRAGHPASRTVWFTKLDVDPEVKVTWRQVSYVVLSHQDGLAVHLGADWRPTKDTRNEFPTLGKALAHATTVHTFGVGLDSVTISRVDRTATGGTTRPGPGTASP